MNPDTERALMEVYDELVRTCTNLRRAGCDPVISMRERDRLMAMADGVNMAISQVVEMLRVAHVESVLSEHSGASFDPRVR